MAFMKYTTMKNSAVGLAATCLLVSQLLFASDFETQAVAVSSASVEVIGSTPIDMGIQQDRRVQTRKILDASDYHLEHQTRAQQVPDRSLERRLALRSKQLARILGVQLGGEVKVDSLRRLQALLRSLDRHSEQINVADKSMKKKALEIRLREFRSIVKQLSRALSGLSRNETDRHNRHRLMRVVEALENILQLILRNPELITTKQRIAVTNIEVVGRPAGASLNDACGSATPIGNGTLFSNLTGATNDGSASCGFSNSSPDIWFKYTAPADGIVAFDTFGSAFDTVLSLHSGCPGTALNELNCDDDTRSLQSLVSLAMTTGEEVFIRVAGYSDDTGVLKLKVEPAGAISGTVTVLGAGTPIENTEVDIYDSTGGWWASANTDAAGNYDISGLPGGTYFARTFDDSGYGFLNEIYNDIPCVGSCDVVTGTRIAVTAPEITSGIDFLLAEAGTISGTVTQDGSGTPIENVEVDIYDSTGDLVAYAFTDATGNYSTGGLPDGTYFARTFDFSGGGYLDEIYDDTLCTGACDVMTGAPIELTVSGNTGAINFSLAEGGTISGRVTEEATGTSIENVEVDIYDISGNWVSYGISDAAGDYISGGLPGGTYFARTVDFSAGGFLDELYDDIPCVGVCDVMTGDSIGVTQGFETSLIDFSLLSDIIFADGFEGPSSSP